MLETHDDGPIRTLRLARAPVNALNPELIGLLHAAVREPGTAEAIIVTGQPGIFSGGLDIPTLMGLDEASLRAMWKSYFGLCHTIAQSPAIVCAAISGHSPAGGAVLALHMDYRIMAEGKFLIGLNETRVGLALPESIYNAFAYVVGPRHAERMAVSGLMVHPPEALRVGLVDEVVSPEVLHPRAIEWCQSVLALPRKAMLANRAMARRPLVAAAASYERAIDGFMAVWKQPETQAALKAFLAKLKK